MSARRDMEVSLYFVSLQATVDATRVRDLAPTHARALGELPAAPRLAQDMLHVHVLLLLRQSILVFVVEGLVLVLTAVDLVVPLLHPQHPARVFIT